MNLGIRNLGLVLSKSLRKAFTGHAVHTPSIKSVCQVEPTAVDAYWNEHTVNSKPFRNAVESERYLQWRFEQYPLFREFMQMYGEHDNEIILDYGCGPGDDVVGFLLYTNAKQVIGIDVSEKALRLASQRLGLHKIDPKRVELIRSWDSLVTIPLDDNSVDYIQCGGVLHHTSDPASILHEFYRVLRPERWLCVMVYNRNSIWFHLYVAYIKMIVEDALPGSDVEEAFSKSTDGERCPIARSYLPEAFMDMANSVGFESEFLGGYLSLHELRCWKQYGSRALGDPRLAEGHKEFLGNLAPDGNGYPTFKGKHAGIGGVYRMYKR